MSESLSTRSRIVWLDGIKGISCFFIFFHHFFLKYFPASIFGPSKPSFLAGWDLFLSQAPFLSLIVNGNFFVHLFIFISGYVVSYQVMTMKPEGLGVFILKRYLKLLFPLAVFSLFTVIPYIYNCIGQPFFIKSVLNKILEVVNSLFFGILICGNDTTLGGQLWMMNYIFMGNIYVILITSLCWQFDSKKIMYIPLSIIVILILIHTKETLHFATVFLGGVFYLFNCNFKLHIPKYLIIITIIISLFLGGYPTEFVPTNIYKYVLIPFDKMNGVSKFFWHGISAFLLIFGISQSEKLKNFFSKSFFVKLSSVSLWVFLLHNLVISYTNSLFNTLLTNSVSYIVSVFIIFVIDTVLLFISSYLFSRIITPLGNKLIASILNLILKNKNGEN